MSSRLVLALLLALALASVFAGIGMADESSDLSYKYIGNRDSGKFHRPDCPFAMVMNKRRRLLFHTRDEAVACGQSPCHYCLPQTWTTVHATVSFPAKTPDAQPETKTEPNNELEKSPELN